LLRLGVQAELSILPRGIMARFLVCALLVLTQVGAFSVPIRNSIENRQEEDARAGLKCKCYEGERCWPSLGEWKALNTSVDGLLVKVVPIAASCYNTFEGIPTYNAEKCAATNASWHSQAFM
jgi:hypothetical protein